MPASPSLLRLSRSKPIRAPMSRAIAKSRMVSRSKGSIMPAVVHGRREAEQKAAIRERAAASGIAPVRFTGAALPPAVGERYRAALADGDYGTMDWLAREPERRSSPDKVWPGAR